MSERASTSGASKPQPNMMARIGTAITRWALVESRLFDLCDAALGGHKDRSAVAFYRTATLGGRLELVDELIEAALGTVDAKAMKEWKAILKDAKALIETRNIIAHQGTATSFERYVAKLPAEVRRPLEERSGRRFEDDGYSATIVIAGPEYQYRRRKHSKRNSRSLTEPQVEAHIQKVKDLNRRLSDFAKEYRVKLLPEQPSPPSPQ